MEILASHSFFSIVYLCCIPLFFTPANKVRCISYSLANSIEKESPFFLAFVVSFVYSLAVLLNLVPLPWRQAFSKVLQYEEWVSFSLPSKPVTDNIHVFRELLIVFAISPFSHLICHFVDKCWLYQYIEREKLHYHMEKKQGFSIKPQATVDKIMQVRVHLISIAFVLLLGFQVIICFLLSFY